MTFSPAETASRIDHTLLRPDALPRDIENLCFEAVEHGFKSVCINPWHLPLASRFLKNEKPFPITVVGFPLGAGLSSSKACEAADAVAAGAREIDMVMNIGALKADDHETVATDIQAVVRAAGCPVKVILETCLLSDAEKALACRLATDSGAAFVKTSTGFSHGGAKIEDIVLTRREAGPQVKVKASGRIKTYSQAVALLEAGAERLGTSASVSIIKGGG